MSLGYAKYITAKSAFVFLTLFLFASANTACFAANGSVVYTYDALGRVTTASYDTGVIVIYAYDANGNRTKTGRQREQRYRVLAEFYLGRGAVG
jgi:YD repeat-containing protein